MENGIGRTFYAGPAIDGIADPDTRDLLVCNGLPTEDLIFEADPAADVVISPYGTPAVCLGQVSGGRLCVDPRSGEVFVSGTYGGTWYVNKTVRQFALSLAKFDEMVPFHERNADDEVMDAAVAKLVAALTAIDPSALSIPGTHWQDIVADVADGDYGAEE
ncbi:SUKH-4 family immunity protein [Dactylosporangium sp. NPDC050688]|uniref:SUKH-4 family immunity protein n=1 Tax=Dactylosporangium sp. NPDC050688 TaxID=3157217 RepID=UPI0033D8CD8B